MKTNHVTLPHGRYDIVVKDAELVILGDPMDAEDEEISHNCDAMGCGQEHVIVRAKITHIDTKLPGQTP